MLSADKEKITILVGSNLGSYLEKLIDAGTGFHWRTKRLSLPGVRLFYFPRILFVCEFYISKSLVL